MFPIIFGGLPKKRANTSSLLTDLLAFWRFDGDGSDSSGNGQNINSSDIPSYTAGVNGIAGYAVGYTEYPFQTSPFPGYTISFWFQPGEDVGVVTGLASIYLFSDTDSFGLVVDANNGGDCNITFANSGVPFSWIKEDCSPDMWVHVAVTISADGNKLYVDGQMVAENSIPALFTVEKRAVSSSDGQMTAIDNAGIWGRVLSADEIMQLATTNKTPTANPNVTPPVPDFAGVPTNGANPLSVLFAASITGTADTGIWESSSDSGVTWTVFSVGTGDAETEFSTPGTYSVRLSATNAGGGATQTKIDYITVTP